MASAGENITCGGCEYNENCRHRQPEVIDGNREIWYLLQLAGTQWRTSMAGPEGLDYGVIIEMAKAMAIEINQNFFEKLRAYEITMLEGMRKKKDD